MAVYYKFKSAKDYDSIPIDGHFISVANLKDKIFETKHLGRGTDFDLMVSNAQTNEEYADEAMLIPKNTSVLVRRVPGRPRLPIVTEREETNIVENKEEDVQQAKSGYPISDSSAMQIPEENEWDEFGNDLYAIPEVVPVQSSNQIQDAPPQNKADEDSKIKALIDTSALEWQRQTQEGFGPGRGFGRGMGGRMMGGRGFGRGMGFERKTPPPGYICHRCKVPGHFIQHCPTNGDPNFDIKRVKPPTGIPKSMLMATPDGSYALPSGAVAVLKPNEAAFEKEIEGLPSTNRTITDIPPELRCPLCKEVMQDAVLTSKCCFTSFCDKCIRNHIISKSMCVCGVSNVLADDLLPNKTLRDTINRLMESNNSSADNAGSMLQVQDMESARPAQPKIPSPTLSAASKGEQRPTIAKEQSLDVKEAVHEANHVSNAQQQSLEKGRSAKIADASEATYESMTVKGATSQCSAPMADEEVHQNPSTSEPGKKKKKKKVRPPNSGDLQWRGPHDVGAENYMMPFAPAACNPYWGGMNLGMDGFMNPYAGTMPYMGYVPGPFDPLGGMLPQDPFGGQGYMMPVPPPRDMSEFAMSSNPVNPVMSREEFEARKADLRRKREMERRVERDGPKDQDYGREVSSNGDIPSMKSKHRPMSQQPPSSDHYHRQHHRGEREPSPDRPHRRHHYRDDRERELSPERSNHHHFHSHHHYKSERESSLDCPPRELDPVRPVKRRVEHDDLPPRELEPIRATKRRSDHEDIGKTTEAANVAEAERKQKASVFSRISFPDEGGNKKRKLLSTENGYKDPVPSSSSSHHHRSTSNGHREELKSATAVAMPRKSSNVVHDNDSSDDERHFKRRPSRYEPLPVVEWEEDIPSRHSRSSRERDYERERGHKHR